MAASDAMSGPARGVEVMKHTIRSLRRSLSRDHQGRSAFGAKKICERKASEDDAAKGEHLACSLYQVSVGVELGLVRKPVERATCLGDRCGRQLLGIPDLDQHMHPGVGGNAAPDQLRQKPAGLGVKNDLSTAYSFRPLILPENAFLSAPTPHRPMYDPLSEGRARDPTRQRGYAKPGLPLDISDGTHFAFGSR